MEAYVKTTLSNGLARIRFFHPAQNSLPGSILAELAKQIEIAGLDDNVKLLLIESDGDRSFCAGASFDELASIHDFESGCLFFSGFANVILAMRNCPKVIVGRIHGKAIGGGVGLAAAMDYTIANRFASIRLSELAVGIGPFVIGPVVERKVGTAAFQMMALNPEEWQTAAWAKEKGLFFEVFESTEQMDLYLNQFIDKLLNYNPDALAALKKVFWENSEGLPELLKARAAISGKLVLSPYCKQAIHSFKTKK